MTPDEDRRVLAAAPSWQATPGDDSSLRTLRFSGGGAGRLTYGYGQTIYARIRCRWEIPAPGCLRITYRPSPPYQRFPGYTPPEGRAARDLGYTLAPGRADGVRDIVPAPDAFDHVLELHEAPWPAELDLPYGLPRVFHGRVAGGAGARPESAD